MVMSTRPRIAILMDENTSSGGTRYEASKGYFHGIVEAGGAPFGIPYAADLIPTVLQDFDGLLCVGGRFACPADWYAHGTHSSPESERLAVERVLIEAFLEADRPVLGICAGMQVLACLHGGRLAADIPQWRSSALPHNGAEVSHSVEIVPGTLLHKILGVDALDVNSFHDEALTAVGTPLRVAAFAPDGVIEAIELPTRSFALGIQWHQELFASRPHVGNRIFEAFVSASQGSGK
jgi:putative glutamine amidotransferase